MRATAKLAGLFAAHGIWCVSDGSPVIPILACESADGEQVMHRLASDDFAEAIRMGKEALEQNTYAADRAVLVFDAFINLESGRTDALIVEAVNYGPERESMTVAVPYRPADDPRGFAVHRLRFIDVSSHNAGYDAVRDAFIAGVDSHPDGAAVYDAHFDNFL